MKQETSKQVIADLFFARMAAGVNHCLAISCETEKDGTSPQQFFLWGWGSNEYQALGKPESIEQDIQPSPVRIYLENKTAKYVPLSVSVGNQHSMILACSEKQFIENFKNQQNERNENFSFDYGFKNLDYKDCVVFSSGNDDFGQQGRITDKEQSQEEIEEGDQDDDEDEEPNAEEECFKIKGIVEGIQNICQISCGSNYTLALDINGQVFSWGEAATGCLGLPVQIDQQRPTKIDFDGIRMKFISAGPSHAASISEAQGCLYTWGIGTYGQLGHGNNKSSNLPICVETGSIHGKQVDYVSCGGLHTACATSDGYAHTFGFNKNGQLGTGDYNDRSEPAKVHAIQNFYACYVQCGGNTTFITTLERLIFAFGSNANGRLGIKDDNGRNYADPQKLDGDYFQCKQQFIYQFALSYHYGMALLQYGTIISFGLPFKGILGRDLMAELLPKVQLVNNSMNDEQKIGEDDDEEAEYNINKLNEVLNSIKPDLQAGLKDPKIIEERQFFGMHSIEFINKLQKEIKASSFIVDIKCGAFHTVALTDAGEVWVWGSNKCMQHGLKDDQVIEQVKVRSKFTQIFIEETINEATFPSQVTAFSIRENKRVTYLATGYEYVVVVENRRNIYSWGKNDKGQLGLGYVSDYVEYPTMLTDLEGFMVKQVACGEDHTLILDEGGTLYSVGNPADGKLGVGYKNQQFVLSTQKVPFIQDVAKVAAGPHHSMALVIDKKYHERVIQTKETIKQLEQNKQNYVIYTWGNGYGGKLGHGNLDNQYYPKLLQTKYSFQDISAGSNHSGALTTDEQLIVWGVGSYLGITKPEDDNDDKQHLKNEKDQEAEPYYIVSPIKHVELANKKYKSICLGDRYNMAITKQNKVFAWGLFDIEFQKEIKKYETQNPSQREKYIESMMNNFQNTPISDIQFQQINCSFNHAFALTENTEKKELFAWGFDGMTGRLGLGYEFLNPDRENEMQLQNKTQQPKKETFKSLNQLFLKPTPLLFINQYLDYNFKQQQLLQLMAQRNEDEEDEFQLDDDLKKKDQKDQKKGKNDIDTIQIGKGQKQKNPRVYIGAQLGIVEPGKLIYKQSWEQFISECKPDIYKCTFTDKSGEDGERKSKKLNFFDEKVVDDVFETVIDLQLENQNLFKEIKDIYLEEYKYFKNEATLTIINKIQRQPFNIQFKHEEKDKKKEKSQKKHPAYSSCSFCYKIMFTMLQIHPCYLVNIYLNGNLSKTQFVDLAIDTYGEIQNDKRKYRLFINLILKILQEDLQNAPKKLMFTIDDENDALYTFSCLFVKFQQLFAQSQTYTLKFIQTSIKRIEDSLTQGISKIFKPVALAFSYTHLEEPGCQISIPPIDGTQLNKFFQERVEFLKKFWEDFGNAFIKLPQEVSPAVRELFLKTYEIVKPFFQKQSQQQEQIQCRMLGLFYINFQKTFSQITQQQEAEKTNDQKLDSNFLNVHCFLELFNYYINDIESDNEKIPQWQSIIEILTNTAQKRTQIFQQIAFGANTSTGVQQKQLQASSKYTSKNEINKIKDIYLHSIDYTDDIITPKIKVISYTTKCIVKHINKIKYVQAENQDMLEQFVNNIKNQQQSYLTDPEPDEQIGNERIQIKLKTRQLYYTTTSLNLRHCNQCGCYAIESFLNSEDNHPFQRFDQWNPVSLAALLIRIVGCFKNKKEFDDFMAGMNSDVASYIKKKITQQRQLSYFGNILKLNEFKKAFEEKVQFNIEQSDDVAEDKKQIAIKENKKVLRELRVQIQQRLISVYKYIFNMEKNLAVLDSINQVLQKKKETFTTTQVGLYNKIISNCYYGMANKELIKTLQSNPVAMVTQIKDAIKQVSTSTEIYENIDVFKKSSDKPSYLSLYGNYSFNILKSRNIIESIKNQAYEDIKKHTRQQVNNKIIEDRLQFTFQKDTDKNNLEIVLVYSEVEFDWKQTVSCGLIHPPIEPIEFIVDKFIVETSKILSMRKAITLGIDENKSQPLGKYCLFKKKGIMLILDELTNHAVIYDHLYVEPEQKEQQQILHSVHTKNSKK